MADESLDPKPNLERVKVLKNRLMISEEWEVSDSFVPANTSDPLEIHTIEELVEASKKNPSISIEARVLGVSKGKPAYATLRRKEFIEACERKPTKRVLREACDAFADGADIGNCVGGSDFLPLLGGPFFKQLYYYDYIRMHAASFYAYNHDPMGRRVVQTMRDFTISRDWKVEFQDQRAQAIWDAFVKVNSLYERMELAAQELSIYGETFVWWLPNNEVNIAYDVFPEQLPGRGALPRVRLIDPSVIWEIVTYPEDIERVLYYKWVAPTQYQTYSGRDGGKPVGISKFIVQQIPAQDVQHYKVNSVSNEKRGRSDLFAALGYMKRLRDSVNYSIIGLQKAAAWCVDTEIDGSEADINAYVQSQQAIGTIPPAGSEFVHSAKVKRNYLGNVASSAKGGQSTAFDWCVSMIAAATGIPIQYLGTHLSGAQTRASAIVATEPVVKVFETRRNTYRRMLEGLVEELFKRFGVQQVDYRIIFPELVSQDRSMKLKDLTTAQMNKWVSRKTAAEFAAKELNLTDYNYETEERQIASEQGEELSPLVSPGMEEPKPRTSGAATAIDGEQRRRLDVGRGQ